MYNHQTCDVKTMCYIVFISHSLHWHYIKTALQEYVIITGKTLPKQAYFLHKLRHAWGSEENDK